MKARGFTLIELLIVLAIVGIIAAIIGGPRSDVVRADPNQITKIQEPCR